MTFLDQALREQVLTWLRAQVPTPRDAHCFAGRSDTLGRPAMSAMSCSICLVDSLEPGRGQTESLKHLRALCYQDLSTAVYQTCNATLTHPIERGRPIHPRAVLPRNWFLTASRQRSMTQPQPM